MPTLLPASLPSLSSAPGRSGTLREERGVPGGKWCLQHQYVSPFFSGRPTTSFSRSEVRRRLYSQGCSGLSHSCMQVARDRSLLVCAAAAETQNGDIRGVVITGGTKGLGFAMAHEFLAAGDKVLICSRSAERSRAAASALARTFPNAQVHGVQCDVTVAADVEALGRAALERLGTVHLWINNAGGVTAKRLLADVPGDEVAQIAATNVVGSLLGSREAIRIMRSQELPPGNSNAEGSGTQAAVPYHIFNMGFSRWGAAFSKTACTHKSTKTALTALSPALAAELKEAGINRIGVHNLSPGMALTDLLLRDSTPGARRFFNALAEEPETVAAWLVPRIRALDTLSSSIDFLSPPAALLKVLLGLPQIINGGRFFDKQGNRVVADGKTFTANGVRVLYANPETDKYANQETEEETDRRKVPQKAATKRSTQLSL
eukprot:TRINITY_DN22350_c0_g1_i1.p1 TRINITY_DN22350_c0_g1~~TRINITY_DN22350_c0_g1_i1.p1  ORF type:complete len:433 (+),score=52.96 TRINITY_DN22350_c0_g1_i1:52-1350(+)